MNERIQELFKQAYGYSPSPMGEPELEKFAELIIRECAKSVVDFYKEDEFTCYSAAEEIKNHFGVE